MHDYKERKLSLSNTKIHMRVKLKNSIKQGGRIWKIIL